MVYTIEGVACLYVTRKQFEHAVQLFACADVMRKKLGNPRPLVEQRRVDTSVTTCLAKLGEAAFSDAYEDGKNLSLDDAVAFALAGD